MPVSTTPQPRVRPIWRLPALLCVLVIALLASSVGTAEAQREPQRQRDVVQVQPVPVVEQLRLRCAPDVVGDQRGVLCQWSESTRDNLRAYQLYRIENGSARQLLTTVRPDGRLGYFDTDVSAPSSLVYGVVARNRVGRVIGLGGPVHVQLGADIAELRLACGPDSIDGQRGVLCRWSETDAANARGYLLYRLVSTNDARELIARVGLDGRTAHFDTNIVAGALHTYGVVAVDRDGNVVAQSPARRVQWPAAD